jgi:hypothetical protein
MKTISCDLCESAENVIEDFRVGEDICTDCLAKIYAVMPYVLSPDELTHCYTKGLHVTEPEIFDKLIEEMDTYLLRSEIVEALKQGGSVRVFADQLHPDYQIAFIREVTSNESL